MFAATKGRAVEGKAGYGRCLVPGWELSGALPLDHNRASPDSIISQGSGLGNWVPRGWSIIETVYQCGALTNFSLEEATFLEPSIGTRDVTDRLAN